MYNASNVRALTCVRRKCAWGGHALLDACVSPTSFLSVRGFAPEGQHRSKSLLCAVRPFHAWLGASLPSHSSSVNESSGQDELPRRAMRDTPLVGRALSDSTCKMCALRCMLDRAGMGGSHFRFHSSPKTAEVCGVHVRFLRRACVERFCKQYACGALYACEYNARTNGGAATHNPIPHSFCNDRQPSSCAVHAALVRIACVERFNIELDEPCADGFHPPSESLFEAHDASTCSGAIDDARRIVPFGGSTTTAVS